MNFWKTIFAFCFLPLYFGGSSKSSNATTTNYTTYDDRVAAAEGAVVIRDSDIADQLVKVSGSNNSITTADPAIVRASLDFARNANAAAGITLENVLSRQNDAVAVLNAQQKGIFSERTLLLLVVAGAGLLFVMRKK